MSAQGIGLYAKAMTELQQVRLRLLRQGAPADKGKIDIQDLELAQLLYRAEEAVNKDFLRVAAMKRKDR